MIAVHEMIHAINKDRSISPRMLIKVDIEKAYDTFALGCYSCHFR